MSGYTPSEEEVRAAFVTASLFAVPIRLDERDAALDRFLAEDRRKTAEPLLARVATLEAQVAAVLGVHHADKYGDCQGCGLNAYEESIPVTECRTREALDSAATS